MAQVKLDKVCKIYEGGVMAVREFNLLIGDGEFVVFVGPSGCGKSTTLRMLAGLEEISSGTISIDGKVVNEVHPKDRDIAMVFQNYALYPHMTVYKNMALALELRRVPKPEIQRRVMEAAKTLGLEPYLERRPKALSGGQRQRVAVGRAIVREPKAFLFDEPLSNLDAKLRVSMRAELKAMHQRLKTTTVYVTHDQEEAMTLGDRIVVMAAGIIQQAAPPMEVYRRPANMFVAGFVGIPPMNFLPGVLVTQAGGLAFVEQGGATVSLGPRGAVGTTPMELALLDAGEWNVRLHLDGYQDWEDTVVLRAGERLRVSGELTAIAAVRSRPRGGRNPGASTGGTTETEEASAPGRLSLNTRPWSRVYLGSRLLGTTPLGDVEVGSGTVRLRLVDRDGVEHTRSVSVPSGGHAREFFDLSSE